MVVSRGRAWSLLLLLALTPVGGMIPNESDSFVRTSNIRQASDEEESFISIAHTCSLHYMYCLATTGSHGFDGSKRASKRKQDKFERWSVCCASWRFARTFNSSAEQLVMSMSAAFFVGSQSSYHHQLIPLAGRTHKSEELTDVYRRRPTIFPHVQWLIGWQFIGWNGISWHEQEGDIFRETR